MENTIANLEKQHEWIGEEKGYVHNVDFGAANSDLVAYRLFGRQGTPYDFTGLDVHSLREKARELESQQKSMKKKVNPKAMNMIDR